MKAARKRRIYSREPICYEGTIPVFSSRNEYVRNYERIASDHMEFQRKWGQNPWIEESLWAEMETSTVNLIRKYSRPGQRILDVGVGLGRVLSGFRDLDRYGMDISLDYLQVAQGKGILVSNALVEDMPYVDNLFDIVVCTDVLEHVIDLNLSCRKMLGVLRPGGILIVRVPYKEDMSAYVKGSLPYKYVHLRNFDEYSLKLLFEKIFFCAVIEIVFTGFCPFVLGKRIMVPLSIQNRMKSMVTVVNRLPRLFNGIMHIMGDALFQVASKALYRPLEINMVVRKGENPQNSALSVQHDC